MAAATEKGFQHSSPAQNDASANSLPAIGRRQWLKATVGGGAGLALSGLLNVPKSFLLSSIAAGTALIILIEMWIAKGWKRQMRMSQLASMGQITFWSLLVYLLFRLADMGLRGQMANAFSGSLGALFAIEVVLGGVLPLAILSRSSLRARPGTLFNGALLTTLGVILNRVSVVYLAMPLRGAMSQNAPETYFPSIFEWGVSIGLIAASVFLFGLGARLFPLLPREGTGRDLVT